MHHTTIEIIINHESDVNYIWSKIKLIIHEGVKKYVQLLKQCQIQKIS